MLNCKDLNCVKKIAENILKNEGIDVKFDVLITDLPYNMVSKLEGSLVKINSRKYESFSTQVSGESELISSYLLLGIISAFIGDVEKIKVIISKYLGEDSVTYKLIEVMFK